MNESLDLRNRILKMRESNNLVVTKTNSLNNDLMSKFESSIKDDNSKPIKHDKNVIDEKNKQIITKSLKSDHDDLSHHKDKSGNKTPKTTVNDNEAQFLMLANKFNEAVEVILELSQKVEKLERNASQNPQKRKTVENHSSFLNFKVFIFLFLISIIILGFFTLPIDFSFIELIILDILSEI